MHIPPWFDFSLICYLCVARTLTAGEREGIFFTGRVTKGVEIAEHLLAESLWVGWALDAEAQSHLSLSWDHCWPWKNHLSSLRIGCLIYEMRQRPTSYGLIDGYKLRMKTGWAKCWVWLRWCSETRPLSPRKVAASSGLKNENKTSRSPLVNLLILSLQ